MMEGATILSIASGDKVVEGQFTEMAAGDGGAQIYAQPQGNKSFTVHTENRHVVTRWLVTEL